MQPERRFIELLAEALASGHAHVADRDGSAPDDWAIWGWRQRLVGTGSYVEARLESQGLRVGWLDGDSDSLYLYPATSVQAAGEMDRDFGVGARWETVVHRCCPPRWLHVGPPRTMYVRRPAEKK